MKTEIQRLDPMNVTTRLTDASRYEDHTIRNISDPGMNREDCEFEDCTFIHCDFSEAIFKSCTFTDCEFKDCNLAMIKLINCQLNQAVFKDCKLSGVSFTGCTVIPFSASFDGCIMDYCSFATMKIPRTSFANSTLKGTDFSGADLSRSVFNNSDLTNAVFNRTNLKEADFRTAKHFIIDPENNTIRKAKFSLYGVHGLLNKYDIRIEN